MSIQPTALDRLLVYGAIAALAVAFRGTGGVYPVALRLGCCRLGFVPVRCLRIGGLRPERETDAKTCGDCEPQHFA